MPSVHSRALAALLPALVTALPAGAQDLPLQGFVLQSQKLGQERRVFVWVPPGYERGKARYPVLYLTDGRANLPFVATEVAFLVQHGRIPPLLVVGIDQLDRTRELTPTPNRVDATATGTATAGGADAFLAFLEAELIPWIDGRYRTAPFRILAGHSFGGLFALHTLHARPALFGARIAISPTVTWNRGEPLARTRALLAAQPGLGGTLVVGAGDEPDLLPGVAELGEIVKGAPGLRYVALRLVGEDHGTAVFPGYYQGLAAVFDGWRMPVPAGAVGPRGGLAAVRAHYDALSARLGYAVLPPEPVVNLAGYQQLADGDVQAAIATFQQNAAWYPESANARDSLGEAFEAAGQLEDARREYQRAWEAGEKANDPNTPAYRTHHERVTGRLQQR